MGYDAFWTDVRRLETTTSTNDDVAAAARTGAPEGLVVVADMQTEGRGRLDRQWVSPARAGLTFSVLLRPSVPEHAWTWLPLLAGVALAEAWSGETGVDIRLKWPNDLLAGGRKVGGILSARVDAAVVVGIGLNVTTSAAELPVPEATSLALEQSRLTDRERLLAAALDSLGRHYAAWAGSGGDGDVVRPAYVARCVTVGSQVEVVLPDSTSVRGLATGIDEDGRLLVATSGGERALSTGDVVHVRGDARLG